ncbi:hypothetical protein FHX03_006437 [Rhizobium sp. BK456]|nr:hypothetical protein [Rhizobium sp. BK456]
MPAAKAQALLQGLRMIDADPAADAATLERVSMWALTQYSPIVADGPERVFGERWMSPFQGFRTRRGTYAQPDRCSDQFEGLCEDAK